MKSYAVYVNSYGEDSSVAVPEGIADPEVFDIVAKENCGPTAEYIVVTDVKNGPEEAIATFREFRNDWEVSFFLRRAIDKVLGLS